MGIFLALVFLIANLLTNSHYGFTFDLQHHFNAGLWHLGMPPPKESLFVIQPYGPISDTVPVLSWLYFHKYWGILPPDEAYHLPLIITASIGIFLAYKIAKEIFGFLPAFFGTITLAFFPRFLGEIHNNMKDGPSSAAMAFALFMYLKLIKKFEKKNLLLAALAFAIAFNTKVNSLLIFPIIIAWLLISFRDKLKIQLPRFGMYLLLAIVSALFLWSLFWDKPYDQLINIWSHFSKSTTGFLILYFGKSYYSNINVPWHYAFGYLLAVTPVVIIGLFLIGFIRSVIDTITLKNRYSGLLIAWFLVPLLKYLYPKVGVIDGIRHFLEVVFPLSIMAGLGASVIVAKRRLVFPVFALLLYIYLLWQIVPLHPYETAYYSEWLGGVAGAYGKFDIEYWGNALKEGSAWINKHAPKGAGVSVPIAWNVAIKYLNPDINVTQYPTAKTSYLMIINRQSFFEMYRENKFLYDYIKNKTPLYVINREDTPMLWIYAYP